MTTLRDFWPAGPRWPIVFCDVNEPEKEFFSFTENQRTDSQVDEITETDEFTEVDETTEIDEIIIKDKSFSENLYQEEETDFHSKYNPGQATKAVC